MELSAKNVNKALRAHVIPYLRSEGFNDVTGRKLWRHHDGKTDHVEISSMSAYRAKVDGCTTASFTVRIGISLPQYGFHLDRYQKDHIKIGPKGPRPGESQMPIRGVLCATGSPPLEKGPWGWGCHSLWEVNSIEEAEKAAIDLKWQLESYGKNWLDNQWDFNQIIDLLESNENRLFLVTTDNGSHLELDAELPGSPIRKMHIAMAKRALEKRN